jgi:type VI secretion system secreted protein Hcp
MVTAYLKLSGSKRFEIKGPVRDRDTAKDGSIALLGVEHSIISPRDPTTGMPTGKRQHHPITVTKDTDNTSPLFFMVLSQNLEIPTAELSFFDADAQGGLSLGRETLLYKITLNKAFVSSIGFAGQPNEEAKEKDRLSLLERISFVYDSIVWQWTSPAAEAKDIYNSQM